MACAFAGIAWNPLFLGYSIILLAAAEYRRNKPLDTAGMVAGILFLLLALSYGIGKDLALRDNAHATVERSNPAA